MCVPALTVECARAIPTPTGERSFCVLSLRDVRELQKRIGELTPPTLSVYSCSDPRTLLDPYALSLRVRAAAQDSGVDPGTLKRALDVVTETYSGTASLCVFIDEEVVTLELSTELPILETAAGRTEVRWGEPYTAPLLATLDNAERLAVLMVESRRWRLFEVFLGEIAEVEDAVLPWIEGEYDRLQRAQASHPAYFPTRGQSQREKVEARVRSATYRFYRNSLDHLSEVLQDRHTDRLVVIGPERDRHIVESAMPRPLRARLVGHLSSLTHAGASRSQVLKRVTPIVQRSELERDRRRLQEIAGAGVTGVGPTLEALQQGRIRELVVPSRHDQRVFVHRETGYVAASAHEVPSRSSQGADPRMLRSLLPDLTDAFAARVTFLRGESERVLVEDLGGLAGLVRW
jgi:hypothetical protein